MLEFLGAVWAVLVLFTDCYGFMCDNLLNKLCFGVYKAGNGYEIRFHKVEPMLVIFHEQ